MFRKLRNKIIIITMAITTAVLILAGVSIMLFSSSFRPEPKAPFNTPNNEMVIEINSNGYNQEITEYIKNDRAEGETRLIITMLCIGVIIEIAVFTIVYYLSLLAQTGLIL